MTKSVILDSDKKKELSEEQYDAYQLGWTDGDDILFLTKKTNKKKTEMVFCKSANKNKEESWHGMLLLNISSSGSKETHLFYLTA